MFTLDIDLYFWMIDRGDLEDDQRNKVEIEQQRVKLHREYSQRLENAFYVARLMQVIRKTIIKKSKKPFTLDAQLNNLKDQTTALVKQNNWNVVAQELRKFNIRVGKDEKAQIIGGKHSLIHDIVQKLHDFDQNILNLPTVAGPIGTINQKQKTMRNRNQEAHSEMDLGVQNHSLLDQGQSLAQPYEQYQAQNQTHQQDEFLDGDRLMLEPGKKGKIYQQSRQSAAILMDAPTQKSRLEPITQENYQNQRANGGVRSPLSLVNLNQINYSEAGVDGIDFGNLDSVQPALGQAAPNSHLFLNQQFDNLLGGMNSRGELDQDTLSSTAYPDGGYAGDQVGLGDCVNTLNFILESLSQSLGLTQSQAAALLTNNQKYLMHLCIKGMKGKDYSKLTNWYKLIMHNSWKLVDLLIAEKDDANALALTLDVIKCGLFSHDAEVANLCCRSLTKVSSIIYDRSAADPSGNSLQPQFLEWLNNKQQRVAKTQLDRSPLPPKKSKTKLGSTKKSQEVDQLMDETGLQCFIRAYRRHQTDFVELFQAALVQFGRDNYIELFTGNLKQSCQGDLEYLQLMQDIQRFLCSTSRGRVAFIDSGAFHVLIDMCLKLTDSQSSVAVTIDIIQVSLTLLVDLWRTKPEVVQSRQNGGRMTDAIIQALKRGCRDLRSKTVRITSINLMFTLLDGFAGERNQMAPLIYKALTFILIDCYMILDLREETLKNFIALFQKHQNIPIGILCEPLLKQIQINLDKQENQEAQFKYNQNILQPQSEHFTLNTTDFELFLTISIHPKLKTEIAVQLLEVVAKIAWKNIIFTRVSLKLLLTVLARFQNNMPVFEYCQKLVTQLLVIIGEQDAIKMDMHAALLQKPRAKVLARKRSQNGLSNGQGDFNLFLSGANAKNIVQNSSQNRGSMFGTTDDGLIDDFALQQMINPAENQDESSQFMSIKTSEKLIINLLQCLMQSGIKVLVDYIKGQVLEHYIKIEKKLKFRNKGLIYLLGLYDKDVYRLIQFSKQKGAKSRLKKQQTQAQRNKMASEILDTSPMTQSVDYDGEPLGETSLLRSDSLERDLNAEFLRVPDAGTLKQVKVKHLATMSPQRARKLQDRASSIPAREGSYDPAENDFDPFGAYGSPSNAKRQRSQVDLTSKELQAIRLAGQYNERNLKLYDVNQDSEAEQKQYLQWVKDKLKLYKAMFNKYASSKTEKSRVKQATFEALLDQKASMSLASVYQFLADFKISKAEFAKRDDIKKIVKLINLKQESNLKTVSNLDTEGFIEFVLQLGYFMHRDQSPGPSEFMPRLFARLKDASLASSTPLFQRLFEDPQGPAIGDPQLLRKLTTMVNEDPGFELPPGYVKVRDGVRLVNGPNPYPNESEQVAQGILNGVFTKIFGINLVQPGARYEDRYLVKPDIFVKQQLKQKGVIPYQHRPTLAERKNASPQRRNTKNQIRQQITTPADTTDGTLDDYQRPRFNDRHQTDSLSTSVDAPPVRSLTNKGANRNQYRSPAPRKKGQNADIMDGVVQDAYRLDAAQRAGGVSPSALRRDQPRAQAVNRVMADRYERQQREFEDKAARDQRLAKRQETVKKQLEEHRVAKLSKDAELQRQQKEENAKKVEQERKRLAKKKEYYDALKRDYEQERLPQIQGNQSALDQLEKERKEAERKKRAEARGKIQENARKLSEQFREIGQKRDQDKTLALREDERIKRRETIKRDRVAQQAKQVGAFAKAASPAAGKAKAQDLAQAQAPAASPRSPRSSLQPPKAQNSSPRTRTTTQRNQSQKTANKAANQKSSPSLFKEFV